MPTASTSDMNDLAPPDLRETIDAVYRDESRRVFATLVRLVGDFDLAEESMHEAFAAALQAWLRDGVPANPRAWLVSTARFKAIDTIRRRARFDASKEQIARDDQMPEGLDPDDLEWNDDRLRLVFTCCHPALAPTAQIALTLREVCGLSTEQVASAFLVSPATVAQRIVRAKTKIREAKIPYVVPERSEIPERLGAVLSVIYLVFNEGYSASSGETVLRPDLTAEAIRLGRLLLELLPDPEVMGLVALMLLTESRRAARTDAAGDLILLEDQDRELWNHELIEEGKALVSQSLASGSLGSYTLQAAISAVHADALSTDSTDWGQIVALYDLLLRVAPSPVVELNRAVAIAMRDGEEAGLQLVDQLLATGELADYHLAEATRADLCRRLGRVEEARRAYQRALDLARQEPQRRFLEKRLRELA
jgi:RNA polymerase sigma-70 factor (ECF subfamily)